MAGRQAALHADLDELLDRLVGGVAELHADHPVAGEGAEFVVRRRPHPAVPCVDEQSGLGAAAVLHYAPRRRRVGDRLHRWDKLEVGPESAFHRAFADTGEDLRGLL